MPRRLAVVLLALGATAALAAPESPPRIGRWLDAAALEAPVWPAAKSDWPGRIPAADDRGYDVLHYDLDLDMDVAHSSLTGTAAITLRLLATPTAGLRLDLVDVMAAQTVAWDGAPAVFVQAGDSLLVTAPVAAAPGDTATVTVTYGGRPPRHGPFYAGLMFRHHDTDTPDEGPSVANVSEPYSAHSWFPCKDHPADKATLRLACTVADTLIAVSNGVLVAETSPAPGRARFVYASAQPVATYLVGLAISNYAADASICPCQAGDVPLATYAFPNDRALADTVFAPTCDMMRFLEDLAGPYPFADEKYAQAEMIWGGAMENQTATVVGRTALLQGDSAALVVVHELSHQWFGDAITPRRWRDIWLNEGFARYVEALWLEHTEGQTALLAYLHLLGPANDPDLFQGQGLLGDPDPLITQLVYDKGAWLLHMLRLRLGDAEFFTLLSRWGSDPQRRGGNVTTDDFIALASEVAGEDMTPFFTPWLETEAVPVLSAQIQHHQPGDPGRERVVLTQHQQPFFPLTVPVRVFAGAEAIDLRLRCDAPSQAFTIATSTAIDSVQLDPDGWLLFRRIDAPPPLLQVDPPRPNPSRGDVSVSFALRQEMPVTVAIFDARGRRIGRWSLGTLAATGSRDSDPPATLHTWQWNGRDGAGRGVAAGVYWLEIRAGRARAIAKVSLIH